MINGGHSEVSSREIPWPCPAIDGRIYFGLIAGLHWFISLVIDFIVCNHLMFRCCEVLADWKQSSQLYCVPKETLGTMKPKMWLCSFLLCRQKKQNQRKTLGQRKNTKIHSTQLFEIDSTSSQAESLISRWVSPIF